MEKCILESPAGGFRSFISKARYCRRREGRSGTHQLGRQPRTRAASAARRGGSGWHSAPAARPKMLHLEPAAEHWGESSVSLPRRTLPASSAQGTAQPSSSLGLTRCPRSRSVPTRAGTRGPGLEGGRAEVPGAELCRRAAPGALPALPGAQLTFVFHVNRAASCKFKFLGTVDKLEFTCDPPWRFSKLQSFNFSN